MSDEKLVHHQTKRGADISLAKRQISQESYCAVLEGRIDLKTAKELGRDGAPDAPDGTETVQDAPPGTLPKPSEQALCWCGCGCGSEVSPGLRWRQGHDARAKGAILRAARAGKTDELPDTLRAYGIERGLLDA